MASIDKAAIGWTIAIVAVGAGFAVLGLSQDVPAPVPTRTAPPVADVAEPVVAPAPEPAPVPAAAPLDVTVIIPAGSAVLGCEQTNECYLPASASVGVGGTVVWENVDTAAHTVTSGTPSGGPDGNFDSSLIVAGATFEVTFDASGSYDYFCIVHPWMIGDVQAS